ncbi:hypothetical protein IH785_19520 [candidate division KSB1 bacterium]|nr:hypothetical protein [candidate division KSB1 bacterium]
MLKLLTTEFDYHKTTLLAYGFVIVVLAFFMPDWPADLSGFQADIPIYVTFAMAFSILSKAKKENRERLALLLPVSLKRLAVARILLATPFILGMTVLSLNSSGKVLEEIGQQILFLNVIMFAMIHHDLRSFHVRMYRIIFYFITVGYLGLLIAFYDLAPAEVFFWGILVAPFLILLCTSYAFFMRRKLYYRELD